MFCKNCGSRVDDNSGLCSNCRNSINNQNNVNFSSSSTNENKIIKFCKNCGSRVDDNSGLCVNCKNMLNNQDNINNNANNSVISTNNSESSIKPKKKKKKHGFLKFCLCVILLILLFNGFKALCNNIAYNKLEVFADKYPFKFSIEDDSVDYITGNFTVPTSYKTKSKKTYNVTWSSNNKAIVIDDKGNAVVDRSNEISKNVTLTQKYKFLLGSAKYTYNCVVIPDNKLDSSMVKVVNKDEIINKTYEDRMELQVKNNSIRYMYGEFGEFFVNSKEDALVVANAYKNNLGINNDITFKVIDVNTTDSFILYKLQAYYQNIELYDNYISLTVSKDLFNLVKITNNVSLDTGKLNLNYTVTDPVSIAKNYLKEKYSNDDYIITDEGIKIINNNAIRYIYVLFSDGRVYSLYVNMIDGSVTINDLSVYSDDVTCSGNDEFGKKHNFKCTKTTIHKEGIDTYYMSDRKRRIEALNNYAAWKKAKDDNASNGEKGLEYLYSSFLNNSISSSTNKFNDPLAVESYVSIQKTYDWYLNKFNRYSYDNKGSSLIILVNSENDFDNASWNSVLKRFYINKQKEYKYAAVSDPVVLGHEYTHAVFGSFSSGSSGIEYKGINEGYADVMGFMSSGNTSWKMGKNYKDDELTYFRDIASYTGEGKFSKKYKDAIWKEKDGEEHTISILISHIGYAMDKSKLFTKNDIAKIWYDSMALGFDDDSTMVDARKNLIQSTERLGYGKECMDFIAHEFDLEEIFDASYEITTEEFMDNTSGGEEDGVFKTDGKMIDGDLIFDDNVRCNYVVFVSPLGMIFGNVPIYIWSDKITSSKEDISKAEKYIEDTLYKQINDDDSNYKLKVNVEYRQLPKPFMKIIKTFLSKSDSDLRSMMYSGMESSEGDEDADNIVNFLMNLTFMWDSVEMTPYRFYKYLGVI